MNPESEFESFIKPPRKRITVHRLTKKMRELQPGEPPLKMSLHPLMAFKQYARRMGWNIVQQKDTKHLNSWKVWRLE